MNIRCRHDFMQALPLRENLLVCRCGYTKRIGSATIPPPRTVEQICMDGLTARHTGVGRLHPTGWKLDQDRGCKLPFAYNDWLGYEA